jgi:hypothetical protein
MKIKIYPIDIYATNVCFIFQTKNLIKASQGICEKYKIKFEDFFNHIKGPLVDSVGFTFEVVSPSGNSLHVVVCCKSINLEEALISISHELSHVSLKISESIKYNPLKEQEPFCYLQSMLMDFALKEMKRTKTFLDKP